MFCPEPVRLIFSNFLSSSLASRTFSSVVYGSLFTIPLDQLAASLNIPRVGEALADESELPLFNFDYAEEFHDLMGVHPAPGSLMPVSALMPALRMLHYCITRVFVPRAEQLDLVLPLDLWIIAHAVEGVPLDYSHLVFGTFYRFSDPLLTVPLPFGPLITNLLLGIHVDVSVFHSLSPSMFPSAHDVMDAIEIPNEGEDGGVVWISSSDSSSSSSDSDDGPNLEPFVEALQALMEYGS
ncbi:unnamed protein product [Linum trigynum]